MADIDNTTEVSVVNEVDSNNVTNSNVHSNTDVTETNNTEEFEIVHNPTKGFELDAIFTYYGSDKTVNGYAPMYEALFRNIRQNEISLLEIGIGTMIEGAHSSMVGYSQPGYAPGGSLRSWRDYFPNGTIVGFDVQADTQFTDDRITTHLCDSTVDKEDVDGFFESKGIGQFDIIIDDGSHVDYHQLTTLENFFDKVKSGGFYIIEDIYPGSKMYSLQGEFRSRFLDVVGDNLYFFTERKNFMVISKR
jgi:hypothetical protein